MFTKVFCFALVMTESESLKDLITKSNIKGKKSLKICDVFGR